MKTGKMLKKCISLVIAVAIMLSIASPAFAEVATLSSDSIGYLAMGDDMTNGIGLETPKKESYTALVAKALYGDSWESSYQLRADSKYRIEELRYMVDNSYDGDGYTAQFKNKVQGIEEIRDDGTYAKEVASADYITISAGVNNFSTYIVEQMLYFVENGGAVKYSYDIGAVLDEYDLGPLSDHNVYDVMENVRELVNNELMAAAGDTMDNAIELVNFVADISVYTVLSYITNFNALINGIYKLNSDAKIFVVGIYNPLAGEQVSVTVEGKTYTVNIGKYFNALIEIANAYTQILAPRKYDYTYVHPGNPQLLIDVMGNASLSIEERIPTALKKRLLNESADTAVEIVQSMLDTYGITKTYWEAYELAENIFTAKTEDERFDEIYIAISGAAVEVAKEALEAKIEELAGNDSKSINVKEERIATLLADLKSAEDEAAREELAAEFAKELIAKALVGKTVAGITFTDEASAIEFMELLETYAEANDDTATDVDPDAQRNLAADMVMQEIGENNVLGIAKEDIVELLEDMDTVRLDPDTADLDAALDETVNNWLTEKSSAFIAKTVQAYVPSYTVDDAKGLLAEMEADATDDDAAIAKAHLLAHFTPVLAEKMKEKYTAGGFTLQTQTSFTDFANNINNAADEAAVKALVRNEIRAAAAKAIFDYLTTENDGYILWAACSCEGGNHVDGGTCSGVSLGMVTEMLLSMDAQTSASAKDAALETWLVDNMFDGVTPTGALKTLFFDPVKAEFSSAYSLYEDAATTAETMCADYHSSVNQAAETFGSYTEKKGEARELIINKYKALYDGGGDVAQVYYADYKKLLDQATAEVLKFADAVEEGKSSCADIGDIFNTVFKLLCEVAEVETISLNDILAVAEKVTEGGYIEQMKDNLLEGNPLAKEDKTVAYLALRYYIGGSMMIMPSARGHETIANQIIKAIKGGDTSSTGGYYANKVIDKVIDVYSCAKGFYELSGSESGQVGTLINPKLYVALGDDITSGTALDSMAQAYPQLVGDALAMAEDDGDYVRNYALNGMRVEELLMLVSDTYEGDEYTVDRFGVDYVKSLRESYRQDIINADLITVNAGINNLTTYPITQTLLAYNGEEPYAMDWGRFIGDSRATTIDNGIEAGIDLVLALVNKAENHVEQLDGYSAYERCERALRTVTTAVESMLYGFVSYVFTLDDAIEHIATLNPDGTIAIVGFYNPLEGTYFQVNRTVTVRGHEVDLSQFKINVDKLGDVMVNISNRFLAHYVGNRASAGTAADAGSRLLNVTINNTELHVTNDSTVAKDLSTLADAKDFTVKGKTLTLKVPQYFLEAVKTEGDALQPNAAGHVYIRDQILDALNFEIHADVIVANETKIYGDADPSFEYLIDDLSSLWDIEVTKIGRVPGENVGTYNLIAYYTAEEGYAEIDEDFGFLEIVKRQATVNVTVSNGVITGVTYDNFMDADKAALEAALVVNTDNTVSCTDTTINGNYDLTFNVTVSEEEPDYSNAKVSIDNWAMELDGVIYMNVYFNFEGFPEGFDYAKNGGLLVWTGDGKPTISSSEFVVGAENCMAVQGMFQSNGRYGVKTPEIFAKNIGDKIYVRAYVQVGENEYIYADKGSAYSPAEFCYNDYLMYAADRDPDICNVCAALLDYGAQAQKYFNYNTDNLVTDHMAAEKGVDLSVYDEVLAFNEQYLDAMKNPTSEKAATLTGTKAYINLDKMTMNLQGAIRLAIYYEIDPNINWADVKTSEVVFWNQDTFETVDSLAYDLGNYDFKYQFQMNESQSLYYGMSDYIVAKNLSDTVYYYCRIEMNDGTVYRSGLGRYSPEGFISEHLSDTENENDVDTLVQKIAVYGEMARICFSK